MFQIQIIGFMRIVLSLISRFLFILILFIYDNNLFLSLPNYCINLIHNLYLIILILSLFKKLYKIISL
jgi:hypothetical protein